MTKLRFLDLRWLLESRERSRNLPLGRWLLQGSLGREQEPFGDCQEPKAVAPSFGGLKSH